MKDIIPGLDAVTSTSGAFVSSGAGRPRVVRKPAALRHRSTARGDIASSTASGSIDLARGSADSRWPPHPFIKATSIVVVHSRLRSVHLIQPRPSLSQQLCARRRSPAAGPIVGLRSEPPRPALLLCAEKSSWLGLRCGYCFSRGKKPRSRGPSSLGDLARVVGGGCRRDESAGCGGSQPGCRAARDL